MKKLHLVLLFFSIAALVCGCGPTVEVDGRYYRALDEDEIHQLVLFARSALARSPKAVSPAELTRIQHTEPQIEILYRGDKDGSARLEWEVNGRRICMVFHGKFLTEKMGWLLETRDSSEQILDFTKPQKPAGTEVPAGRR